MTASCNTITRGPTAVNRTSLSIIIHLSNGHLPLVLALYTTIHITKILKVINNNYNNTNDTVYGAVIMTRPLQEFTRFITWMQTRRQSATNPQIKPSNLDCVSICRLLPTPVAINYQNEWYLYYHPMDGRRLSWPMWLATYRDGLPARRQSPIQVSINRVRRKVCKPHHQ